MSLSLVPDYVFPDYRSVTPAFLQQLGVTLLLCDLDYTLAPKARRQPDEALRRWLGELERAGIRVTVVSNNRSGVRAGEFCAPLGLPYVRHAGKPSRRGLVQAMEEAGKAPTDCAFLGDKLLTDVLAAKRMGIPALMVEPLEGPVGAWNHVLHLLQRPFKARAKANMRRRGG
ncbi:MAG: YqeG family HAD IIIA-type phosphatase [Oscillospiraceae bacterium]